MTVDEFLRRAFRDVPTCRLATLDPTARPHVARGGSCGARRACSCRRGSGRRQLGARASATLASRSSIDRGRDWTELAGVRVDGVAELMPAEHPEMRGADVGVAREVPLDVRRRRLRAVHEAVPSSGSSASNGRGVRRLGPRTG